MEKRITKRMTELEERMAKDNKSWKAEVTNVAIGEDGRVVTITTPYSSEQSSLDEIMHKIRLDIMTCLHNGLTGPITIRIRQIDV